MKIKKFLLLAALLPTAAALAADLSAESPLSQTSVNATDGPSQLMEDRLHQRSPWQSPVWYEDELYLYNIRYGCDNPVAISQAPYATLTDISGSFTHEEGLWHPIDANHLGRLYDVHIYGIQKIGKCVFEGSLDYGNHSLQQLRWNGTLLTSARNPFLVADSIRGDFDVETFNLNGSFSYALNTQLSMGIRANLLVGSKADQMDPRPDARGSRATLNPGLEYRIGKSGLNLGLSGIAEVYHEDIKYSVTNYEDPLNSILFIFKEMGFYERKEATGYTRRYNGTRFGGHLQAVYENSNLANLLEGGMVLSQEAALDGGTEYKYRGGEYSENLLTVSNRLQLKSSHFLQDLTVKAAYRDGSSKWFKQKQGYDESGNTIWNVVSGAVSQKETYLTGELSWQGHWLQQQRPSLSIDTHHGYESGKQSQYPDEYSNSYTATYHTLAARKYFQSDKLLWSIGADAKYRHILSSSIDVTPTKAGDVDMYHKYTEPKFQAEAASSIRVGLTADASMPLEAGKRIYWLKVALNASLANYLGDYTLYSNTDYRQLGAKVCLIF